MEQTITSTKPLDLREGYQLGLRSVGASGKTYLQLSKNGIIIDSKVIQPSIDNAQMSDKTYYYKTKLGKTEGIIQIAVHFKNAFRGTAISLASYDGIFQLSDLPIYI